MDPPAPSQGYLQARLALLIGNHFITSKLPCRVAAETGVQQLKGKHNVRTLDVLVSCLPQIKDAMFGRDPVLIVEIVSPPNKKAAWESIQAMATIPAVTEIAVVRTDRIEAQGFHREADGGWPIEALMIGGGTLRLQSIGYEGPLIEGYEATELAGAEPE